MRAVSAIGTPVRCSSRASKSATIAASAPAYAAPSPRTSASTAAAGRRNGSTPPARRHAPPPPPPPPPRGGGGERVVAFDQRGDPERVPGRRRRVVLAHLRANVRGGVARRVVGAGDHERLEHPDQPPVGARRRELPRRAVALGRRAQALA